MADTDILQARGLEFFNRMLESTRSPQSSPPTSPPASPRQRRADSSSESGKDDDEEERGGEGGEGGWGQGRGVGVGEGEGEGEGDSLVLSSPPPPFGDAVRHQQDDRPGSPDSDRVVFQALSVDGDGDGPQAGERAGGEGGQQGVVLRAPPRMQAADLVGREGGEHEEEQEEEEGDGMVDSRFFAPSAAPQPLEGGGDDEDKKNDNNHSPLDGIVVLNSNVHGANEERDDDNANHGDGEGEGDVFFARSESDAAPNSDPGALKVSHAWLGPGQAQGQQHQHEQHEQQDEQQDERQDQRHALVQGVSRPLEVIHEEHFEANSDDDGSDNEGGQARAPEQQPQQQQHEQQGADHGVPPASAALVHTNGDESGKARASEEEVGGEQGRSPRSTPSSELRRTVSFEDEERAVLVRGGAASPASRQQPKLTVSQAGILKPSALPKPDDVFVAPVSPGADGLGKSFAQSSRPAPHLLRALDAANAAANDNAGKGGANAHNRVEGVAEEVDGAGSGHQLSSGLKLADLNGNVEDGQPNNTRGGFSNLSSFVLDDKPKPRAVFPAPAPTPHVDEGGEGSEGVDHSGGFGGSFEENGDGQAHVFMANGDVPQQPSVSVKHAREPTPPTRLQRHGSASHFPSQALLQQIEGEVEPPEQQAVLVTTHRPSRTVLSAATSRGISPVPPPLSPAGAPVPMWGGARAQGGGEEREEERRREVQPKRPGLDRRLSSSEKLFPSQMVMADVDEEHQPVLVSGDGSRRVLPEEPSSQRMNVTVRGSAKPIARRSFTKSPKPMSRLSSGSIPASFRRPEPDPDEEEAREILQTPSQSFLDKYSNPAARQVEPLPATARRDSVRLTARRIPRSHARPKSQVPPPLSPSRPQPVAQPEFQPSGEEQEEGGEIKGRFGGPEVRGHGQHKPEPWVEAAQHPPLPQPQRQDHHHHHSHHHHPQSHHSQPEPYTALAHEEDSQEEPGERWARGSSLLDRITRPTRAQQLRNAAVRSHQESVVRNSPPRLQRGMSGRRQWGSRLQSSSSQPAISRHVVSTRRNASGQASGLGLSRGGGAFGTRRVTSQGWTPRPRQSYPKTWGYAATGRSNSNNGNGSNNDNNGWGSGWGRSRAKGPGEFAPSRPSSSQMYAKETRRAHEKELRQKDERIRQLLAERDRRLESNAAELAQPPRSTLCANCGGEGGVSDVDLARLRREIRAQVEEELRQQPPPHDTHGGLGEVDAKRLQLERELREARQQLTRETEQRVALEQRVGEWEERLARMDAVEDELRQSRAQEALMRRKAEVLERESADFNARRRYMHNVIQELKGNIRVFCRVRPAVGEAPAIRVAPEETQGGQQQLAITFERHGLKGNRLRSKEFAFDRVFQGPEQEPIFDEISQLVQSALDGYHVCIFAYGQTGSGKTFTMEGNDQGGGKFTGVIPRSFEKIFACTKEMERSGHWKMSLECQYVEIYNEELHDLLAAHERRPRGGYRPPMPHQHHRSAAAPPVKIKDSHAGGARLEGAKVVRVTSEGDVQALLHTASAARAVAATDVHARSSRSHSVFQLTIQGSNGMESVSGKLNLIDLAGSERLSKSHSRGERLGEAIHINKSLSCLADVISALANKDPHVPYRNSKLTYLLQESLQGDGKVLMFCNVAPEISNAPESLCTLRFAETVARAHIGTAKKKARVDLGRVLHQQWDEESELGSIG